MVNGRAVALTGESQTNRLWDAMIGNRKNKEKLFWDQNMKNPFASSWGVPKLMVTFLLVVFVLYMAYAMRLLSSSSSHSPTTQQPIDTINDQFHHRLVTSFPGSVQTDENKEKTSLRHVVFGIGASAKLWDRRKDYIKLWWRPHEMRGIVWLDEQVRKGADDDLLPPRMISEDTSKFPYNNTNGDRSALRISRIVSETLRLGMEDVRWFVMGDDDTVFFPDNLVRVLSKYDHNQFYYIGSSSESHLQNIYFSYGMAYGGGGFAISYPLAKALERMQDRCMMRYPSLYGSDDRIHACMSELGVPLTKERGFHQLDIYGSPFGLLAAHPVTPLVSLHHLDLIQPIFPDMNRVAALKKLLVPMRLDSAGLMQQSICYDKSRVWTVSVSWGYAVQIFRGIFSAREMEVPARTFLNWYMKADYTAHAFNTRPLSENVCQKPFVYYISDALYSAEFNETGSEYIKQRIPNPECKWDMADPSQIDRVEVYKKPYPNLWDKEPPRRNCCRVLPTEKEGTLVVDVGVCREDEIIELR